MAGRRAAALLVSALLLICCATVVAAMAGGKQVVTGGDPFRVTPTKLRSELAKIGVSIRYVHPRGEPAADVSGVARDGKVSIGFEFQLYSSSDEATAQRVGRLRAEAFDWPARHRAFFFLHWNRGVLGNVAFAEYEQSPIEGHASAQLERNEKRAWQKIRRGLDDALFSCFPRNDPYTHALSVSPK